MAGSSEVLQEYLVKLGFRTDTISLRKFEDSLGATGKKVFGIGSAVATTAVAIEASAAQMAYAMRNTYFQASLAGTTTKNWRAMAFAGKQVGVSAEAMGSAIHNMGEAMRLSPGKKGLLASFGIDVSESRKSDEIMMDWMKRLGEMPEWMATKYAALTGMDADTYHQLRNNLDKVTKSKSELAEMYRTLGVDQDKADQAAIHYAETLDRLSSTVKIVGGSIMVTMTPVFDWMASKLTESIKGWDLLLKKMMSVGDGTFLGYVKGGIKANVGVVADALGVKNPYGSSDTSSGATVGATTKEERDALWAKKNGLPAGSMTVEEARKRHNEIMNGSSNKSGSASAAVSGLMADGWSREQALGIAANLKHESSFNPHAVGDGGKAYGIAQWHPDRQAEFAKWAGKDMKDSNFGEQLKFISYELRQGKEQGAGRMLANATSAEEAAKIASKYYERPGDVAGEMAARAKTAANLGTQLASSAASTITQNLTMNIQGNVDEKAVPKIKDELKRAMADSLRNNKASVQ